MIIGFHFFTQRENRERERMAGAAVEVLLDNLQQLLLHHHRLIGGVKEEVELMERDLHVFKSFLRDTAKKRRKDETLQGLVRELRDLVYEAEDIIDAVVTQAAETKSRNYFFRAFTKPVVLQGIAQKVAAVSRKIGDIYGGKTGIDLANLDVGEGDPEEIEVPVVRRDNVVDLEDEANKLIRYLTEQTQHLDVISIVGMPGIGKTTLARTIFDHPNIRHEFPICIWVRVSPEFTRKNVFLAILKQLAYPTDDTYEKSDREVAQLVAAELESKKFLIVMDDVWMTDDWDKLKISLPKNNNMCKVLITSRQVEVGRHANRNRDPHNLRLLTFEESCLLLCLEALGTREFPEELEVVGKEIAMRCCGLPLAIVVMGDILAKRNLASPGATRNAWERVSKSMRTYLMEDPERRVEKIISSSYDNLPYHLRACFFYLGMFPEDFEIPVWKLIRMWIAEGFIQQKDGISLEETAECYLEDLISRSLVRVDKTTSDGRAKTCRIHGMLRVFCKTEAGNQKDNFLQEMKYRDGHFDPPISNLQMFRRLCVHTNVIDFISSTPDGPRVRSFACFSKEEIALPTENISTIPTAFKLLRVLDVKPIKFSRISSDLYRLVHLRYIHLSFDLDKLPRAFSRLCNIQTFIVDTTSRTLEIKADIWQLIHLRHFKTNASATLPLPKPGKSSKGGEKLQTLGTISPQSCTEEVLDQARNMKKLGIRGRLASLSFDDLQRLDNLEKLKLLNDVLAGASSDGQLRSLPPPYKFPPNLRKLTLSTTFLDWNHMSTLGLLENLKVLKLKDRAFTGERWEAIDGGFRRLKALHIGRTNLAIWVASGHHFPRLRRLELHNCDNLQQVPFGLADIPTFHFLELHHTKLAAASAKKIREAKEKQWEDQQIHAKFGRFKLSIFPADE